MKKQVINQLEYSKVKFYNIPRKLYSNQIYKIKTEKIK